MENVWFLALGLSAALAAVLGLKRRRERAAAPVEERAQAVDHAAAGEPDPVLDPVYLERLLELQRHSGRNVVPLIVDSFVTEWPRRLERMRNALARGDRQDLVLVAHTLKGGSAQLGALRVASVSRELEESGKGGRLDGAGEILDRLERELEAASAALLARGSVQEKAQEAGASPP